MFVISLPECLFNVLHVPIAHNENLNYVKRILYRQLHEIFRLLSLIHDKKIRHVTHKEVILPQCDSIVKYAKFTLEK